MIDYTRRLAEDILNSVWLLERVDEDAIKKLVAESLAPFTQTRETK